jgi:hypothetical protein
MLKHKNKKSPSKKDPHSLILRISKSLNIFFEKLSDFFSEDLLNFAYKLTVVVLICQLLLMALGLIEFSWEKVGITSFLMFVLKSTDWRNLI